MNMRVEHDLLGDLAVPAEAWYGIQTQRALDNFSITGVPISHFPALVRALVQVKSAAAWANRELGVLPAEKGMPSSPPVTRLMPVIFMISSLST